MSLDVAAPSPSTEGRSAGQKSASRRGWGEIGGEAQRRQKWRRRAALSAGQAAWDMKRASRSAERPQTVFGRYLGFGMGEFGSSCASSGLRGDAIGAMRLGTMLEGQEKPLTPLTRAKSATSGQNVAETSHAARTARPAALRSLGRFSSTPPTILALGAARRRRFLCRAPFRTFSQHPAAALPTAALLALCAPRRARAGRLQL